MSTITAGVQSRSSSCVKAINADLANCTVDVVYNTGSRYIYSNVDRDAIARLLSNPEISLGFWAHNNLIKPESVTYKLIKA